MVVGVPSAAVSRTSLALPLDCVHMTPQFESWMMTFFESAGVKGVRVRGGLRSAAHLEIFQIPWYLPPWWLQWHSETCPAISNLI